MDKYSRNRSDQLYKPALKDIYKSEAKRKEPTVCVNCHALYQGGRWIWGYAEASALSATCPACQRLLDNAPAGFVAIDQAFYAGHRKEILELVRATEEREKAEHALERIMAISEEPDQLLVTTTGTHLANRIGHALTGAYKGKASFDYDDSQTRLDVYWAR